MTYYGICPYIRGAAGTSAENISPRSSAVSARPEDWCKFANLGSHVVTGAGDGPRQFFRVGGRPGSRKGHITVGVEMWWGVKSPRHAESFCPGLEVWFVDCLPRVLAKRSGWSANNWLARPAGASWKKVLARCALKQAAGADGRHARSRCARCPTSRSCSSTI